jgi:hypothetical protein
MYIGSERGTRTPDQRIMIRLKRENEHYAQQTKAIESATYLLPLALAISPFLWLSVPPVSRKTKLPALPQPQYQAAEARATHWDLCLPSAGGTNCCRTGGAAAIAPESLRAHPRALSLPLPRPTHRPLGPRPT